MQNPEPEDIAQLQLERLQSTLNRADKNVPFHRNRFLKAGIDLSRIEKILDLARFPFMERKHLGEHYPYGLFAVPLRDIVRIHTAPGTMTNPTVSGYTKSDLLLWQDVVARALAASGVTAHDIVQIRFDAGLANWGRDYKSGAEAIEASVIPNTSLSIGKQLMVTRDYKTSVFITTPSVASLFASQIFKSEINPTCLNLKTLILVGEYVDDEFRKRIEDQLHVKTWLHYGLSEVPGPSLAFECKYHQGLHVNEDHFLPEIIDPETGELLKDGETGELVLTTLTTRAFPLIRFRTGDRACLIRKPCECKSPLSRIKWFENRTDDLLSIGGVKVHHKQIRYHIERSLGTVPTCYHFVKKDNGTKNLLEIWIAVDENLFSDEIKMLERIMHSTGDYLQENLGVPVRIRLKEKSSVSI